MVIYNLILRCIFPKNKEILLPKQNTLIKFRQFNVCTILLSNSQSRFQIFVLVMSFIGFFLRDQDPIQDQAIAFSCHVSLASFNLEKFLSLCLSYLQCFDILPVIL